MSAGHRANQEAVGAHGVLSMTAAVRTLLLELTRGTYRESRCFAKRFKTPTAIHWRSWPSSGLHHQTLEIWILTSVSVLASMAKSCDNQAIDVVPEISRAR